MKIRPKYVAARAFYIGGRSYEAGEEITDGVTLQTLLRFGDQFATNTASRRVDPPIPGPDEAASQED